ncbi:MAG TPA: hypothetical protein PKB10_09255 [Tepidisphaeraceae bacterium]|nr:hypothetical protein [Tepidisphaeraceae bacterium]
MGWIAVPAWLCGCTIEAAPRSSDRLRDLLDEGVYGSVTIPLGRAPAPVPDDTTPPTTFPGTPDIRVAPGGLIAEPTPVSREQIRAIISAAMRR